MGKNYCEFTRECYVKFVKLNFNSVLQVNLVRIVAGFYKKNICDIFAEKYCQLS